MKKLIALILVVVCVLGLIGCNETAEIQIDKVVMTHSSNGDKSSDKVTITDKETISELLAMYNSLQTVEKSRPLADERIWVIFYMGEDVEIEWCISAYGNDLDNAEFISCSTLWSVGNHLIKSNFDYNRVVEIFNSNCYFDSGSDLAAQFPHFMAKILEIHDNYLLVEPEVGMEELKSADKFEIPLDDVDNPTELQVDDSVLIVYDGEILETYPAKLGEVYSVGKMIIIPVETKSTYTYEELSEMPANELLDLFIQNGLVINDDLKASFTEEELQKLFKENFDLWHTGVSAHSHTTYCDLAEQTKVVYDKIAKPKE